MTNNDDEAVYKGLSKIITDVQNGVTEKPNIEYNRSLFSDDEIYQRYKNGDILDFAYWVADNNIDRNRAYKIMGQDEKNANIAFWSLMIAGVGVIISFLVLGYLQKIFPGAV